MNSGTIHPDGRVTLDGCTPEKTRLVGVTAHMIAIHHPGGRWWNNGGENYTAAWIDVMELEDLRPGNEPGSWRFRTKRMGRSMSFHPTIKQATDNAVFKLERDGESIVRSIENRAKTDG